MSSYFLLGDGVSQDTLIIKLTDSAKIQMARDILAGRERLKVHVNGTIAKGKAPYNPQWSFYVEPNSVTFFQTAMEQCVSTIRNIEDHLNDPSPDFASGSRWCPWHSKLIAELPNLDCVGKK